jgi:hypothetical protein
MSTALRKTVQITYMFKWDRDFVPMQILGFFSENRVFDDNVEKYGTAGQGTDDNILRRMRFMCWITKATNAHSV